MANIKSNILQLIQHKQTSQNLRQKSENWWLKKLLQVNITSGKNTKDLIHTESKILLQITFVLAFS